MFLRHIRKSLRLKISSYFIIVAILPVFLIGSYSIYQSNIDLLKEKEMRYKKHLLDKSNQFESWCNSFLYMADTLRFNRSMERFLKNRINSKFDLRKNLVNNLEPILNMLVTINKDISNVVVYTSNDVCEYGKKFTHLSTLKNKPYYSMLWNERKNFWVFDNKRLYYFCNLYTIFNKFKKNYVCFEIRKNFINEFLDNNDSNTQFILLNKLTSQKFPNSYKLDNKHINFNQKIEGQDWILIYSINKNLYNHGNHILWVSILVLIICFIVIAIIVASISKHIVAPINHLINKMHDVESGNLDVNIVINKEDEIGTLAKQFNKMTNKIKHLIDEVYTSNIIQKEAELSALQAKINPHFLYNSLSIVSWMAILNEQNEISDVLETLVVYYKTTLNNGSLFTTIENELKNVKAYIDIQLIIKDNSFDITYDVDPSILNFYCVNLTLQPLVENALEHGIRELIDRRGLIIIKCFKKDDKIILSIHDNGIGIDNHSCSEVFKRNTSGYGITNVHERNKMFFGTGYNMSIDSQLDSYTCVSLTFPKIAKPHHNTNPSKRIDPCNYLQQ